MAKRTQSRAMAIYSPPARQQAPIIRIAAPRPVATKAPKKGRRRHHSSDSGGMGGGIKTMMGVLGGGAALGFIEQQSWASAFPQLPLVGRKGAIAIGAYLLAKKGIGGAIMRDIAIAAAAISGYQLGKEGKVSGGDIDE
jgi:hypothetical protein